VTLKRGKRKKEIKEEIIPCIIEEAGVSPEKRKAWARLIQKIYEVDPLTCPRYQGSMKIIAFIEQEEIIEKILKYLGLWLVKKRSPPKIYSPFNEDYSYSQIPPLDDYQTSVLNTIYCISHLPTENSHSYHDG